LSSGRDTSQRSNQYESVELTAIEIKQTGEKKDWQQEPLHWKLLTSLSVNTVTEALQCVQWYYRWLKGSIMYSKAVRMKKLQLKQASSLQKAIRSPCFSYENNTMGPYQSKSTPDINCEVVLTKEQMDSIIYADT